MAENQNEESEKKVDEGWKQQVAEEKERLKDQEKATAAGGQGARAGEMPEASFQVFLAGLYTQTLMALGEMENPVSGEKARSMPEAQYLIDTIEMLRDKTKGNLSDEESTYLENLLYDLQMRYIEATKKKDEGGQQGDQESESESD